MSVAPRSSAASRVGGAFGAQSTFAGLHVAVVHARLVELLERARDPVRDNRREALALGAGRCR